MSFKDKTIACVDCGNDFIFSVSEQEFYAEKGFENEPKRCPECRRAAKASRNSSGRERKSFEVVCAECGQTTTVPFEPKGDRPVYCIDCFKKQKNAS